MRLGVMIKDEDYRDALVHKLSSYDNDIFVNAFRSFDLEDTDPEKGQMSGIQELFEVGDVLIGRYTGLCMLN